MRGKIPGDNILLRPLLAIGVFDLFHSEVAKGGALGATEANSRWGPRRPRNRAEHIANFEMVGVFGNGFYVF